MKDPELWENMHRMIVSTLQLMVTNAPDHEEARRRIQLVRLELSVAESALDVLDKCGLISEMDAQPTCSACGFKMISDAWLKCPHCGHELQRLRFRFGNEGIAWTHEEVFALQLVATLAIEQPPEGVSKGTLHALRSAYDKLRGAT